MATDDREAAGVGRDAQAVAHDSGLTLLLSAGMTALTVPVAIVVGDRHAIAPLLTVTVVVGALGGTLARRYRGARAVHRWPAVEVVALAWLSTALVGAAVLWGIAVNDPTTAGVVGLFRSPVDALFEATSGITSTGLTVADGIESELPRTVQWWRSLQQWVGGVGVVLFTVGFGHTASRTDLLYEAEGRTDEIGGGVRDTVRSIVLIYLGLTVIACLAFLATEQEPWVALNHGLTGIATGGFTVTDDSFAGYGATTQVVAIAVMVLGAVTFAAHHLAIVERDPRSLLRFTPFRAQLSWMAAGGLALSVLVWSTPVDARLLDAVFQWVSATATAGFSSRDDLGSWVAFLVPVYVIAMVIGAPSGSTGGGLKLDRALWVAKDVVSRMRGGPRQPAAVRWDGEVVDDEQRTRSVRHAWEMLGLWVLTLAVASSLMLVLTDAPAGSVLFDTASAMSNVGLDAGVVGGDLSSAAKLVVTAVMYLGRVELLAALVLASQREHVSMRREPPSSGSG